MSYVASQLEPTHPFLFFQHLLLLVLPFFALSCLLSSNFSSRLPRCLKQFASPVSGCSCLSGFSTSRHPSFPVLWSSWPRPWQQLFGLASPKAFTQRLSHRAVCRLCQFHLLPAGRHGNKCTEKNMNIYGSTRQRFKFVYNLLKSKNQYN